MTTHDHWEQLAAGYALDALEPDEATKFTDHLATCAQCRNLVDDHALVAAQLGSLAGDDVSPPSWSAIRAGIVGTPQRAQGDVVVVRRRPRLATLATAAAAVVVLTAGIATWRLVGGAGGDHALTSAAACRQSTGCHVVPVQASNGSSAEVLVRDGHLAVVPTSMPAPPAGSIWALWQLPRTGMPRLLTEFATGRRTAHLQLPYDETAGFAVSRERAGTTPTSPSVVVATGNAQ